MKLYKIIENIDIISTYGNCNIDIENIEYDSRNIKKNGLFICVNGLNVNGHKFIKSAKDNGAIAFLINEDVDMISGYTYIKVKNTKDAMAKLASNFYNNPSEKINIIGITGTNGKTSISTFLSQVLNVKRKCGLIGTIKIDDGKNEITSKNTTPESLDLQRSFFNMLNNNCEYCAMEVSSHSLALNRIEGININLGIFTNLTEDHLDFHKDLNEYRDVKERLFHKTQNANIINIDDESGRIILNHIKNIKTPYYTYSIENKADFVAKDIKMNSKGVSYTVVTPTYEAKIIVPVPGKFTIYNTLAVISACYILNIPIDIIQKGLKTSKGIEGRFEIVQNNKGINVIVDYAHTPDALENILSTIKEFSKGKVITVFGCGGDRDKQKRPIMGKIAQDNSDITIITSDNPRKEKPLDIIDDILLGIDKSINNFLVIEDRKQAIEKAIRLSNKNDIILIAGKGHETYQIIGNIKYDFDDRKIAKDIINSI
ncbi:UDP-N-acetylmuramoyl-L-alanyl-D-glutamate--2,6-diaminopimelate ligase [Romboutsia sp. Marseille-P6047]|uniref:UDP-N-acetylmuramoyl-L-alanyl-D-glutamate--2, 6-diaminopimelate ligase n=1 Tax=Romboutsia sp. Marseille-P6047 TaxID=2161817 RepID=UPI000F06397F|nr:UDP-N-acetylmuramoyl-L-alanyl-D-glutamate--2,6-diaminopimelate ligase [Romboutsia sp. Marseille-P6047]